MKLGMTGARTGMTDAQKAKFRQLLIEFEITELHHGDCIGADADAHDIAVDMGIRTVVHPPISTESRAFKDGDHIHTPKGYLARDRDIVYAADVLIGTPSKTYETRRSGTWYTLRYGLKQQKPTNAIKPDGELFGEDVLREMTEGKEW